MERPPSAEEALKTAGQAQHALKAAEARALYVGAPIVAQRFNPDVDKDWKSKGTCKLLHFIRHGQGYHNLLGQVSRQYGAEFSETGEYDVAIREQCPYLQPGIQDPPLTTIGRADAKRLRNLASSIKPELLVASPMRRASETMLIGFPGQLILAHEGCREQLGVFICDKRSDLTDYKEDARYDRVDFSLITSDADSLWQATQRETMLEMAQRAEGFLLWLKNRPEKEIAVGTHSAWLMAVFNVVLTLESRSGDLTEVAKLKTFFDTGEVRSLLLHF